MGVVVDTNVLMVASRQHGQAKARCVKASIERLQELRRSGGLLIDDRYLILREYTKNLGFRGQPGAGEAFAKWAHDHQAISDKVRQVAITPCGDGDWRLYTEFPNHASLKRFDRSDQKFVAVANASGENPPILNAIDSDWWNHRDALNAVGIAVEFLCPEHNSRS